MLTTEENFVIDDYVVYKGVGVCRVEGIEEKSFDGVTSEEYFKLVPVDKGGSSYFVPKSFASVKLRKPMTREEVDEIIDGSAENDVVLTRDVRERRSTIDSILKSYDYKMILALIKAIYLHTLECRDNGKKVLVSDENAIRNAENIVYPEFSFVLGIAPDEVAGYIVNRLEAR